MKPVSSPGAIIVYTNPNKNKVLKITDDCKHVHCIRSNKEDACDIWLAALLVSKMCVHGINRYTVVYIVCPKQIRSQYHFNWSILKEMSIRYRKLDPDVFLRYEWICWNDAIIHLYIVLIWEGLISFTHVYNLFYNLEAWYWKAV